MTRPEATTILTPTAYQNFTWGGTFDLTIQACDFRPLGGPNFLDIIDVEFSGIGQTPTCSVTIEEVVVTSNAAPGYTNQGGTLDSAGIDLRFVGPIRMSVNVSDCLVETCRQDGFFAYAAGFDALGTVLIQDSTFDDNGDDPGNVILDHAGCGITIRAHEGGIWTDVDIQDSETARNAVHGIGLYGIGFYSAPTGFNDARVLRHLSTDNGLNSSYPTWQGHGMYVWLLGATAKVGLVKSVFSRNQSSGFWFDCRAKSEGGGFEHAIQSLDCVASLNEGQGYPTYFPPNWLPNEPWHQSPFVVSCEGPSYGNPLYVNGLNHVYLNLAHLTCSDNPNSSYAVCFIEDNDPNLTSIWDASNSFQNSVLFQDHGQSVDQAFYPSPLFTNAAGQLEESDLWKLMAQVTWGCNVGTVGTGGSYYQSWLANQQCFDAPPLLVAWQSYGRVFPQTLPIFSPNIDAGLATTVPNSVKDIRLLNRPDSYTFIKDVGAFEIQQ